MDMCFDESRVNPGLYFRALCFANTEEEKARFHISL